VKETLFMSTARKEGSIKTRGATLNDEQEKIKLNHERRREEKAGKAIPQKRKDTVHRGVSQEKET